MAGIDNIEVEVTILVGEAEMTLRQLMRKGRGAIIPLGGDDRKSLEILANGRKIAEGKAILRSDEVAVEVIGDADAA